MAIKCKACGSCGMSMEKKEDFALGDPAQDFCQYCTDTAGKLLPFEKILDANAGYYVESQGVTHQAARQMALDMLKKQPAWQGLRSV